MAIFGWNKKGASEPPDEGKLDVASGNGDEINFSPTKAAKFFEYAQVRHDTLQLEYAMTLWLDGLRQNPASIEGLEGFFRSAAAFSADAKNRISKDTWKRFSERGNINRYLTSLLEWGEKLTDAGLAVRAAEWAGKLGLADPAVWIGERALNLAAHDPKAKKSAYETLMEIMERFRRFDLAVRAGEAAVRLDQTDAKLAGHVRNLAAESTMSKSGFDQTGTEGGFRHNIRDMAKQRHLEDEERIVKTAETTDRLVEAAKTDFDARPGDKPTISRYVKRLLERGKEEDEKEAHAVLLRAFEQTKEFQFKKGAGEIELKWAKRAFSKAREAAERPGASQADKDAFAKAREVFHNAELIEYEARVAAYPTDMALKFELGKRYQLLGRHEDAIALFQDAQADVKNRVKVLYHLAVSFAATAWHDEAIETFRQALEAAGGLEDATAMEVRYGLLSSLQARAVEQRSLADADEAYKLASSIAMKQINYRDIRVKREELKKLATEIKQG